jgi:hypothetical protein
VNNFCKFLSNGMSTQNELKGYSITPCCWYQEKTTVADLTKQTIDKVRDNWQNIKDWTPACSTCQKLENAGGNSYRLSSFDEIHSSNSDINHLEVMLHNVCGAACIICNPQISSTWNKEYKKQNIEYQNKPSRLAPYMFDENKFNELFTNDFSSLKKIKFWGGEPFINELHTKFLEQIPNKQACALHYTVSGQSVPSEQAYELMSEFKLVNIEISIDGIEDQFEYQRWPIKWQNFVSNINTMRELAPVNVLFRFNHTLNPLNVYYYNKLENWIFKNFKDNRLGDPIEINIHPCWGELDLNKTPHSLISAVNIKDSQVAGLLNSVNYTEHLSMISHCQFWDKVRNLNWKDTFPEVVKYFE